MERYDEDEFLGNLMAILGLGVLTFNLPPLRHCGRKL